MWNVCSYDESPISPYRFTGKERESESGLDDFGGGWATSAGTGKKLGCAPSRGVREGAYPRRRRH